MEKNNSSEVLSLEDANKIAHAVNSIKDSLEEKVLREEQPLELKKVEDIFLEATSTFESLRTFSEVFIENDREMLKNKYMPLMDRLYPSLREELAINIKENETMLAQCTKRMGQLKTQMETKNANNEYLKSEILQLKKDLRGQGGKSLDSGSKLFERRKTLEQFAALDKFIPNLLHKNYPAELYVRAADVIKEFVNVNTNIQEGVMRPFIEKNMPSSDSIDDKGDISGEGLKVFMDTLQPVIEAGAKEYAKYIGEHPDVVDNNCLALQRSLFSLFPKEKDVIHQAVLKKSEIMLTNIYERPLSVQEMEKFLVKTNAQFTNSPLIQPVSTSQKPFENIVKVGNIDAKIQKYSVYDGSGKKIEGDLLTKIKTSLTNNKSTDALLEEALGEKSVVRYVNYIENVQSERADPQSHISQELKNSEIKGGGVLIRYKLAGLDKSVVVGLHV